MRAKLLASMVTTAALMLSGCYPSFLTSRPKAKILVTNEAGAPLQGATVTLGTKEWHGIVGRNTLEQFATDREGRVNIGSRHDWAMQVMLPDGGVSYSWTLCVSKPGFEAVPMTVVNFDEPIKVSMYASDVPSECQWQEHEDIPHVKERDARWIEVAGGDWPAHRGFAMTMDESIRGAMEASAREQGIKLRSWSEYRFQYQTRSNGPRDRRLFVHAICRAPANVELDKAFYSEPDDGACFFETTYTNQVYTDQPKSAFGPLQLVDGKG